MSKKSQTPTNKKANESTELTPLTSTMNLRSSQSAERGGIMKELLVGSSEKKNKGNHLMMLKYHWYSVT